MFCFCGMGFNIYNDVYVKGEDKENDASSGSVSNALLGDIMALCGAFLYALSNILQEFFLKTKRDVHDYLGFLGLFGVTITLIESWILSEFHTIS